MKKSTSTSNQSEIPKKTKSVLQEELVASELQYRRLFKSAKDGILILDAETGKIVDVNPFLIDLLGYSKNEFIEKSIWEIGAFHDIIENKDKFIELQQKEYVRYENLPLETSDGNKILVEFVSNVYLVNNDKVIQCQIRDITARKESEAALEKTANELAEIKEIADELNKFTENVIDTVREPLLAIDEDLRVIKASRSFYKFFNVTAEETIGKLIYELGNHQWDIPKLRELLEEIIPEKNSFDNYEVEHHFSTIGRRVMLLNARQVKRAFGQEKIILLAIEDITERKGKEDTLKETHRATSDFLNILLNHMHVPIIIWDASFVIRRFNSKFEKLSGYDSAEVIGKKIDFLFPKDKIAATTELLKNHLSDEQEVVEIDILTKENNIKTVLWSSSCILDEEGKNIIATISQDITSRKLTEEALKESEEKLRSIYSVAPTGIGLVVNRVLKAVNPRICEMTGYTREELIDKNAQILYPSEEEYDFVGKEKYDQIRKKGTGELETRWIKKDGTIIHVLLASTHVDKDDHSKGVTFTALDITDHINKNKALQEKNDLLEKVFDSNFDLISLTDLEGNFTLVGKSHEILGYDNDSLIGKNVMELVHPDDVETVSKEFSVFMETGEKRKIDYRYKHIDGSYLWLETIGTILVDNKGKPEQILFNTRNITERKQSEERLKENEERYRTIFENTGTATCILEKDCTISLSNTKFSQLAGYPIHEIENKKTWMEFVAPEDLDRMYQQHELRRKNRPEALKEYEFRFIGKNKKVKNIFLMIDVIPGTDKSVASLLDITDRKQAEEKLKSNYGLLRIAGETARFGGWDVDLETNISIWSDAVADIHEVPHGYAPSVDEGINFYAPEFREKIIQVFTDCAQKGIPYDEEMEILTSKGKRVWVRTIGRAVKDENGKISKVHGSFQDVTESKQAEEALRESEKKLRTSLDATPFPIAVVDLKDDKIFFWSHSALELFGHTADTASEWYQMAYPDPDYRQDVVEKWKPFLEKAKNSGQTVNTGEYRITCKDGSERICELYATFLPDNLIVTFNDITERKQAEQVILNSRQRLEFALQGGQLGVWDWNIQTGEVVYSDLWAKMLEYSPEEVEPTVDFFKHHIHPEDKADVLDRLMGHIEGRFAMYESEHRFRTKSGKWLWIQDHGKITEYDSDSRPVKAIGIIQDITDRKQAEELIKKEKAWSESIVNNAPNIIVGLGEKSIITVFNHYAEVLTGYKAEEVIGKEWINIFVPKEMQETIYQLWDEIVKNKLIDHHFENEIILKSGEKRLIDWFNTILTENEEFRMMLSIGADITESKKAEEALKESEENYRSLFSSIRDAILVTNTDRKITQGNPAFFELFGYSKEEILGKETSFIYKNLDEFKLMGQKIKENMDNPNFLLPVSYKKKNGTVFIGETNVFYLKNSKGEIEGFIGMIRDVTGKIKTEKALRESEEKFRGLAENTSDVIAIMDMQGTITYMSKMTENETGYTKNEIEGTNIQKLLTPESYHITMNRFQKRLKGENINAPYEVGIVTKTGKVVPFELNISAITENGEIKGIQIVARDITERKKAEEELLAHQTQLESIVKILQHKTSDVQEFLDFALNEAIALTESKIGYIYFYNEETQEFTLNSWSKDVLPQCSVINPQTIYQLDKTGFWGEAVRQRKDIMVNDFHASNPLKKGFPEGHAPLHKFLTVPVFRDEQIVAVVGVANKTTDYNQNDVLQLKILMDSVWREVGIKQAEEAVKESEQKHRSLIEQMQEGLLVVDNDDVIKFANPAFCNMLGYKETELIGKTGYDFLLKESDRNNIIQKNLERQKDIYEQYELEMITKSGKSLMLLMNAAPIKDEKGTITGSIATCIDITKRKQAEEALKSIEWMLSKKTAAVKSDQVPPYGDLSELNTNRLILDSVGKNMLEDIVKDYLGLLESSSAIYEKNGDYALGIFASGWCRLMDQAARELCNTEDNTEALECGKWLCHDSCWKEASQPAMESGLPVDIECKGGIHLYALPIFAGDEVIGAINFGYGDPPKDKEKLSELAEKYKIPLIELLKKAKEYETRPPYIIETAKERLQASANLIGEIVSRKTTEKEIIKLNEELEQRVIERTAQLEASNKELEAFSYSVSHDLRAPLRHINGYVDMLNEKFREDLPEKAQYYLATVTDSATQMGTLIDELLQFSRTGHQEVRKTKMEMNVLVKEVIESIKQNTENREISWKVQELPQVSGDYSLLKQVWVNLLDNAVKYTRNTQKAEISIGFKEEDKNFVFYIRDNGVGFNMKYAHKLFGVFQRLHSAAEFEGTGIGLANVQRIIHKHNGQVWAEAEPGKGATFFFSLPKVDKTQTNK